LQRKEYNLRFKVVACSLLAENEKQPTNSRRQHNAITLTVNVGESVKIVQSIDPVAFSNITKPFSDCFFEMLPQEANRKFRLFALDATSTPRIHAHTLDDRSYVHQANQR